MAWCRLASSLYLSQWLPRCISSYASRDHKELTLPTGPWWLSWFLQARYGYRAKRHRLTWPHSYAIGRRLYLLWQKCNLYFWVCQLHNIVLIYIIPELKDWNMVWARLGLVGLFRLLCRLTSEISGELKCAQLRPIAGTSRGNKSWRLLQLAGDWRSLPAARAHTPAAGHFRGRAAIRAAPLVIRLMSGTGLLRLPYLGRLRLVKCCLSQN